MGKIGEWEKSRSRQAAWLEQTIRIQRRSSERGKTEVEKWVIRHEIKHKRTIYVHNKDRLREGIKSKMNNKSQQMDDREQQNRRQKRQMMDYGRNTETRIGGAVLKRIIYKKSENISKSIYRHNKAHHRTNTHSARNNT